MFMSMQREEATVIGLDAVGAALLADDLLRDGETLQSVWRYVIVQLLDDYSHDLARAPGSDIRQLGVRQSSPAGHSNSANVVPGSLARIPSSALRLSRRFYKASASKLASGP